MRARGQVCKLEDCSTVIERDAGFGYCSMHYQRYRKHGDPYVKGKGGTSMPGPMNPNWSGERPSYAATHLRLRSQRGPASRQVCVDCGGPARHWSYDNSDPDELIDPKLGRYSGDLSHYQARCVPCHSRFDNAARAALLTGERP